MKAEERLKGWGLSWSKRWHRIDPERANTRALCGSPIYTPGEIEASKHGLVHLKPILADPGRAPVCKRCVRYAS